MAGWALLGARKSACGEVATSLWVGLLGATFGALSAHACLHARDTSGACLLAGRHALPLLARRRDLVNMAKKRPNVIPIIEDARRPEKYRMLVPMVDVIFADVAQVRGRPEGQLQLQLQAR